MCNNSGGGEPHRSEISHQISPASRLITWDRGVIGVLLIRLIAAVCSRPEAASRMVERRCRVLVEASAAGTSQETLKSHPGGGGAAVLSQVHNPRV